MEVQVLRLSGGDSKVKMLRVLPVIGSVAVGPRGSVAEAEWDAFSSANVVVPRFPSGLTITHGKGHWQAHGEPLQREASRVLEIVYDERPLHDRRVEEIAATYKAAFQQESVIVIRMPANVCF